METKSLQDCYTKEELDKLKRVYDLQESGGFGAFLLWLSSARKLGYDKEFLKYKILREPSVESELSRCYKMIVREIEVVCDGEEKAKAIKAMSSIKNVLDLKDK